MIQKLTVNLDFKSTKNHHDNYSWAPKVPYIQRNNIIEFSDKLNIIFGPNGCGKSTLTGLCAFLTASEQGGVTRYTKKWMHSLVEHFGLVHGYPKKEQLIANLVHDGLPTFYHNPRLTIGLYKGVAFDDDFFSEGLDNLKAPNGSTGEESMRKLSNFFKHFKSSDLPETILGDNWMSKHESFKHDYALSMDILQASCEVGNRTFILDEPEMGFSLLWQAEFWSSLAEFTETYNRQVIVATHSPFALNIKGAHYFDMQPGYLDQCRAKFKETF